MRYIAALLLLLSIAICSRANDKVDGHSINLQKQGSHYVFSADINGVAEAKVLLESGIPAMLADSAFIFSSGVLSGFELSPTSGEKINLGGRIYVITHKTCGVVKISEKITYSGEVFILSQYAKDYELAVPVQYLRNDSDNAGRIVRLVLEDNDLKVLDRSTLRSLRKGYSKCRMNTRAYLGMPAVKTELSVIDGNKVRVIKGNFNLDFGNPELVFLLNQHKDVQKFLEDNSDLELRSARNPRGDVVAQFIIAERCALCNVEFSDAVIAITKNLPLFTTVGNIGLKYFKAVDVIFDFDRNTMYISKL